MRFGRWLRFGCLTALMLCLSVEGAPAHEGSVARIAELSRQIARSPDDAGLFLRRGAFRHLDSHFGAALMDFDRAAALDPDLSGLALARGRTLLAMGRIDVAIPQLERASRESPDDPEAMMELGRGLLAVGRTADAAACFAEALRLTPRPRPEHFLEYAAALAAGADGAPVAIAALDTGIARIGPAVALHLRALDLEAQIGDFDAALRRVDTLLAAARRREAWHLRRGELLEQAGRPMAAQDAYCACLSEIDALPTRHRRTAAVEALAAAAERALERLEFDATTARRA